MKLKTNKTFTKWTIKKIKRLRIKLKNIIYYKLGLDDEIKNK